MYLVKIVTRMFWCQAPSLSKYVTERSQLTALDNMKHGVRMQTNKVSSPGM